MNKEQSKALSRKSYINEKFNNEIFGISLMGEGIESIINIMRDGIIKEDNRILSKEDKIHLILAIPTTTIDNILKKYPKNTKIFILNQVMEMIKNEK